MIFMISFNSSNINRRSAMDTATVSTDTLAFCARDIENLAATLAAASNGITATGDKDTGMQVMDCVGEALQRLVDAMYRAAEA